jgi:hypothetical protein
VKDCHAGSRGGLPGPTESSLLILLYCTVFVGRPIPAYLKDGWGVCVSQSLGS